MSTMQPVAFECYHCFCCRCCFCAPSSRRCCCCCRCFFCRVHRPPLSLLSGFGQIRFGGAVDKPMEMTVDYIKANFEEITIPVTLVCAGNRRKEENMIKQGLGYVLS